MPGAEEFKKELVLCLPHLRAFAHMLARDHALAEDLVQDTMVRALAKREQFEPGTNLKRWLIVILRNRFFKELRRSSRKAEVSSDSLAELASVPGEQDGRLEMRAFETAFRELPAAQREALVLVGVNGYSYEEAASISDCAVGTMKSRVSRARNELQRQLNGVENPAAWRSGSHRS